MLLRYLKKIFYNSVAELRVDTIIASADWAWTHARDKSGLIYVDWTGRAQEYDKPKWLLNEACMVELYARIALIKDVNKKIENYE